MKMRNIKTIILVTPEERRERLKFGRAYKSFKLPVVFYFRKKKKWGGIKIIQSCMLSS